MSWLGYCTRCGEATASTKDPAYWPAKTTTAEESGRLFGRDYQTSYGPDGEPCGVHHRTCTGPDRYDPSITPSPDYQPPAWVPVNPARPARSAESPIEQRFREACDRLDAPALTGLVPQYRVAGFRIDFALPGQKIGIELDGFASHSSTADIAKDRRRQRLLEGHGWYIIRFGGSEVHRDADYCAQQAAWLIEHARKGGSE